MSQQSILPPPATQRHELTNRLINADGLFVGLDFDGTLAPIANDPRIPIVTPACRRAVRRLASLPRSTISVISGRELSDLRNRVGLPGIIYAGNHGLEVSYRNDIDRHPLAKRCRPAMRRTLDRLINRLTGVPGWRIEDKGLTASVHVRQTPPWRIDAVRAAIAASIREEGGGLEVSSGKQVFEIRPSIDWDKGAILTHLTENIPHGWEPMYLGDDTTDEDAFRAIQPEGISIHVGSQYQTSATYRIPRQVEVAPFLNWLLETLQSTIRQDVKERPPLRDGVTVP